MEPAVRTSTNRNVPSLDEANRVASFVLVEQARAVAATVVAGATREDSLRELVALTIAVVLYAERAYRAIGKRRPEHWESLERSAETFTDEFVVKTLAVNDAELKRAITQQRRRRLAASAGTLRLVEPQRDKRARWVAVTLPEDAPMPISGDVAEGLNERTMELEDLLDAHLAAADTTDPLELAGQVVGLLSASEILLALLPSNEVAAFCVQLASITARATNR